MITKQHKAKDGRLILSLCDSGLIGHVFEEGDLQLDLASDFYKGEELDESKICILIRKANTLIFIGNDAVKFGLDHNLVLEKNVRRICNVPYAETIIA
ncbi:DUF424 family protein [Candidatus Woesearchaeota archaeon]|nr:DUF424 family protein [Candidatus Woesearchaeota archaeon]